MSFKLRLKNKHIFRENLVNNEENFILEASKVPVSVDFRNATLNATKVFIKSENRNEKLNIIQSNISNLKLFAENMKNSKPVKALSKRIENMILPSILPQFKVKNNHKDRKKARTMKNLSNHFQEKTEKIDNIIAINKKFFPNYETSPKEGNIYDFLHNKNQVLVRNEETVGNLVKYSTIFQKSKGKFKKFYMD